MHIPNGFLSDPVCTATTLASCTALGFGVARMRQTIDAPSSTLVPAPSSALLAATGAGLFAAQMVNFPIGDGASGHVVGAALAAILLGPWRGMLTMAVVLSVQCLLFGDGGLSTLGANVLNMAVLGTLSAAGLYGLVTRNFQGIRGQLLGAALASFGSVLASAAVCSLELAASGTYALANVMSAMISVHAWIALGEAVATVAVLAALSTLQSKNGMRFGRRAVFASLAIAVAVAGLLAPWASSAPDGLERVAHDLNFASQASMASWAIVPDYEAPGVTWPALAVALAGILGVAFVFVVSYTVDRTAKVRVRKH